MDESFKSHLRQLILRTRRCHPETENFTADEWINEFEVGEKYISPNPDILRLVLHPNFHRCMIELEDERLFDGPIFDEPSQN